MIGISTKISDSIMDSTLDSTLDSSLVSTLVSTAVAALAMAPNYIVFGIPDPHPMDELKEELHEITKEKPL